MYRVGTYIYVTVYTRCGGVSRARIVDRRRPTRPSDIENSSKRGR